MGRKPTSESPFDLIGGLQGPTLQALAESLFLPVLLTDPGGRPLLANKLFRSLLGEAPEAGWLAMIDTPDRPAAEALWLAAGMDQAPREAELCVRTSVGMMVLLCRIAPIEQDRRLLGWFVTLSETTRALDEQLEQASAATAVMEAQHQEAGAHPAAGEAAREEAEARLVESEQHCRKAEARRPEAEEQQDDAQALQRDAEARLALAEARLRESEMRRATAEARAMRAIWDLAASDERGRRAAETARAWIEAAPVMLRTVRTDGVPDLHNSAMRQETGAVLAGNWLGSIHPEDCVRALGLWGHAVGTGAPFEAEHRLRGTKGDDRPVLTRAHPVRDDLGALLGGSAAARTGAALKPVSTL